MSTSDDRVISLQFDNQEFEARLKSTLLSLATLDKTIQMAGAKQGLTDVSTAAKNVNLSSMASSLDNISSKFSAVGAIGFTAIQTITRGVLGLVGNLANMAKTDILSPIITGGKSRAEALEQARFQFQGLGIDVNKGMASALAAVKGTAYGLDQAATVAAQFGASGIKAGDDMTRALTGISGIAAMTGRSYSEIGQIFTSAAGAGKVSNMDLQEFAIRGLNAAAAYAKQTGKTEAQVHEMATAGTLDFKSFADAMDKAFGAHATEANKTFTGSLSNLHAAMSRMGASFFSTGIDQARDVLNALSPQVDNLTKAMGPLIKAMLDLTGKASSDLVHFLNYTNFDPFVKGFTNLGNVLRDGSHLIGTLLGIVKTAFQSIFPPDLAGHFTSITGMLDHLIKALTPGPETVAKLTAAFQGIFAVFSIVWDVLKGLVKVIGSFFEAFGGPASHGAMDTLMVISGWLIRLNAAFVTSGRIDKFFNDLAEDAKKPAEFLEKLVDDIEKLFNKAGGTEANTASASVGNVTKSFSQLHDVIATIGAIFTRVEAVLDAGVHKIGAALSDLGGAIAKTIAPDGFRAVLAVFNTALLGGIFVMIKNFMEHGLKVDVGGGFFGQIKSSLTGLTGTLHQMQMELQAKMLMDIAIAIGVLAAAVVVLSMINPNALQSAMLAMAAGFGQLVIVMKLMSNIESGFGGSAKLNLLASSMIIMAGAVVVLAAAVKIFASIKADDLQRGLTGVAVALAELSVSAKLMQDSSVGMVASGVAMTAMAVGLVVMAGAVKLFATMSWGELAKGLAGVAVSLGIIVVAMKLMPVASTLAAGAAMIPLAIGITILAGAVKIFGSIPLGELAKGLVGLAAGLVIIAAAMNLMPLTLPITAAGLVLVAVALGLMVPSIKMIGGMGLAELAKGLGGIAIMLGILAIATSAMVGALPGAAALLVVSVSLGILAGVLKELGGMKWGDLIKGLVAIAAVLTVLGLAAGILSPLIPALLALGAALVLIGGGFALFGAGAFLFSSALSLLAATGVAAAKVIVNSVITLITAIPKLLTTLITSLSQSTEQLLKGTDLILGLFQDILVKLLAMIIKDSPKIAEALVAILTSGLKLIRDKFPDVAQTAFDLLISFLKALDDNLPLVVTEAVKVVITLAGSLVQNAVKLVDAAVTLILAFLGAIAEKAADVAEAGVKVVAAIITGLGRGVGDLVKAAAGLIVSFVTTIAGESAKVVEAGAKILINFLSGMATNSVEIVNKATDLAIAFINALATNAVRFANAAADTLVTFLNGMANAIRTHSADLRNAGYNIVSAIIDGMTGGLSSKIGGIINGFINMATSAVDAVKSALGINSPSKVFMEIGKGVGEGFALGINQDQRPTNSAVSQAEKIVKAFSDTLTSIPNSLDGMHEFQPVVRPILDLTGIKDGVRGIDGLIPSPSISPSVSIDRAHAIATTSDIAKQSETRPLPEPKEIRFEQNIYSPKPLTTNDIYKGTKSQIALAKEELGIS